MKRDTIKVERNFKGMVGHRGGAFLQTENTNLSFIEGSKRSYCALECDVHPTKDDVIVISHDSNLKRVTGLDMYIPDYTYDELRKVEFPDMWTEKPSKNCHIVTLKEYLEICKSAGKESVVELKDTIREKDIDKIIDIIKEEDYFDHVIFISFYPGYLTKIRREYKDVRIQFLTSYMNDTVLDLCVQHNFSVDCEYQAMTKEYIDKFHKYGLKVNLWTLNDKDIAEKFIDDGVDYITTNILECNE